MIMNDYKFQIASILVLGVIMFGYFRAKKLPVMSTKIFSAFLIIAGANLIFDIFSVYTITHIETIPPFINRLSHQLFLGSINLVIFTLFLYVKIMCERQRRPKPLKLLLISIPMLFAVGATLFAPLYYYIGGSVRYSYGPMVVMLYLFILIYILVIISSLFFHKNNIKRESKILIVLGIGIWAVIAAVQWLYPQVLMSSLAITMMALFVYMSLENPMEYMDAETGALNRYAFFRMIDDMYGKQKNFYVISIVIDNVTHIQRFFGVEAAGDILNNIIRKIRDIKGISIFRIKSDSIWIIADRQAYVDELKKFISENEFTWINKANMEISPELYMDIIGCPQQAETAEKLYSLMDYLIQGFVRTEKITVISNDDFKEYERFTAIKELVERSVNNDGFEVYYQPIFSNETKTFASAEALVRLKDTETLGFISPEIFIPIAEEAGYIGKIGDIVFEKVCAFMNENDIASLGVKYIEVNLSGIQAADKNIVGSLDRCMKKHNINPHSINLEITETASENTGNILISNMEKLRRMGCHFSMDDFGTGYSNLSHMVQVKFELIKLDKSLIWPCFGDNEENKREALIILENCVKMLLDLGVKIVAEGIETKEQADKMDELGVTYLQGYYFSRPISAADYLEFLNKHQTAIK